MVFAIFWVSYTVLVMSMVLWLVSHPLGVGGVVLFSYMLGSLMVGLSVSFVMGVFLFLTGVSGMMVAFLYVVALCPNPVFSSMSGKGASYGLWYFVNLLVGCILPGVIMVKSAAHSFGLEVSVLSEGYQWGRDPFMFSGLAELMPFLGALLFLCMVSVVSLCGSQKQCLGGHKVSYSKRSYS
uniref:NADH dehydrogenase subunit 6 n=1 Tax=Semele scabra TaxID=1125679 RepID=I6NIN2_9BIVA|nr:NADH dehydrogenase subunit 6 [Semele scabra]AEV94311.1 NADH dehydrogenase subunit 6 [Semele scabra]